MMYPPPIDEVIDIINITSPENMDDDRRKEYSMEDIVGLRPRRLEEMCEEYDVSGYDDSERLFNLLRELAYSRKLCIADRDIVGHKSFSRFVGYLLDWDGDLCDRARDLGVSISRNRCDDVRMMILGIIISKREMKKKPKTIPQRSMTSRPSAHRDDSDLPHKQHEDLGIGSEVIVMYRGVRRRCIISTVSCKSYRVTSRQGDGWQETVKKECVHPYRE